MHDPTKYLVRKTHSRIFVHLDLKCPFIKFSIDTQILKSIYYAIFDCDLNYANRVWGQNRNSMNQLIVLQKSSPHYELWMQKCSFKSSFSWHEIIKPPDKIIMENCLFISKSINFNLPPIFIHWFTFSSDSLNCETSSSSKGLLKVKTVNTEKYGREAMTNNAILSWNNICSDIYTDYLGKLVLLKVALFC